MMTDRNNASPQSTAERERWTSDSETVERADRNQAPAEEVVGRSSEQRDNTPRRYEQPADDDPVMPSKGSSLDTKI